MIKMLMQFNQRVLGDDLKYKNILTYLQTSVEGIESE